jgi:hypothetical protein
VNQAVPIDFARTVDEYRLQNERTTNGARLLEADQAQGIASRL